MTWDTIMMPKRSAPGRSTMMALAAVMSAIVPW